MSINLPDTMACIRAALMRRGNSAHDAEDLVQEAWMRLARYERDQVVDRPAGFMMRAAIHLSIDAHRMRVNHGEEIMADEVALFDPAPSAEDTVLARERVERLKVCLERLNERTRAIFLAHRVDGLTYKEIARCHGLSVSVVHVHIARATLRLTTWMEGW